MDWKNKTECKNKAIDFLGYGFGLWLLGFALGMLFFSFVPASLLGLPILLVMTPVAIYATLKRFKNANYSLSYYAGVGVAWLAIAVVLDYFLLVKAFNVQNYYDADVIIYYAVTFLIPVGVGLKYGSQKTGK